MYIGQLVRESATFIAMHARGQETRTLDLSDPLQLVGLSVKVVGLPLNSEAPILFLANFKDSGIFVYRVPCTIPKSY